MIVYQGPSKLDGSPIVAILLAGSDNTKTGDMLQLWILRADISPIRATQTGEDAGICGTCPHRGVADGTTAKGRSCYVNIGQAPTGIWKKFVRGGYSTGSDRQIASMVSGRSIRLGAYGDPAALPIETLTLLTTGTRGWTGYTHAWRTNPELAGLCMASCDTEQDRTDAKLAGWRTFRVRMATSPIQGKEFVCPASDEGGKRLQCFECMACCGTVNGTRTKAGDVVIIAHGGMAVKANAGRTLTKLTLSVKGVANG